MKNIFNNLGYTAKHTLVGVALGVATIGIGIGVVSNLGSSPQKAGGAALSSLEQYQQGAAASQAAVAPQYTRQELEKRIAQAERERDNPSVYQLKDIPSKGELGYNAQDAASNKNGGKNIAGGLESLTPGGVSAAEALGAKSAAQDAAAYDMAAAGASQEGIVSASQIEAAKTKAAAAATQKGQLQASARIGSSGGGIIGGGSVMKAGETSRYSGAQGGASGASGAANNLGGGSAFSGGRAGSMGGYNVKTGFGSGGANGQELFTVGELENAALKSRYAAGSVSKQSAKSAALAQAAFDGSQAVESGVEVAENGGVSIGGAADSLGRVAGSQAMGYTGSWNTDTLEDLKAQEEKEWKSLKKKIIWKMVLMGILGLAGAGSYALVGLGGLITSAAAVAGIYACMKGFGKKGTSLEDLIAKTKDFEYLTINTDKWMKAARIVFWSALAVCAGPLALVGYMVAKKGNKEFLKNLVKDAGDGKTADTSDSDGASSLTDGNLTSATKDINKNVTN